MAHNGFQTRRDLVGCQIWTNCILMCCRCVQIVMPRTHSGLLSLMEFSCALSAVDSTEALEFI